MLLGKALRKMIARLEDSDEEIVIEIDTVTIADRMVSIVSKLEKFARPMSFEEIVLGEAGNEENINRGLLTTAFNALLELCKRQLITVTQSACFDDVMISLKSTADSMVDVSTA